jgi:hypothetical protein
MTDHPITPTLDLVSKWASEFHGTTIAPGEAAIEIAIQAARWGWDRRGAANEAEIQKARDEELAACCKVLGERDYMGTGVCGAYLRAARRPKAPSLAQKALHILGSYGDLSPKEHDTIRKALEQLP